ncbi:MAG: anti-sigma factor [Anaerolineaceae bacterium]|nr:anti-sigma factor [Anaerolineaceae bacterium]
MATRNNRCQEAQALLGSYALGATDDAETALVEAALLDCPGLQRELADYESLTDAMLHDVPQVAPPPSLRARILAEAAPIEPPQRKQSDKILRPTWRQLLLSPVGAAAALAIVALFVSNGYWLFASQSIQEENHQLAYDVRHLEQENTQLTNELTSSQNLLSALGTERGGRAQFASNEAIDNPPLAQLAWTDAATENTWVAMFSVANLPTLQDTVYQLWLRRQDDSIISIGTFTVDEEGRATIIFELNEPIGGFAGAGVTIEPPGGSPQPTGDVALGGEI